jgi:hypothetical protein
MIMNHLGDINPADSVKDPNFFVQGLQITKNKYIVVDGVWSQSSVTNTALYIWINYIGGDMGYFVDVILKANSQQ